MGELGYKERMAAFLADERRVQSIGVHYAEIVAEINQLGLDVLMGRVAETDALARIEELEKDERRGRLYNANSVRRAVDEIRGQRDAYGKSRAGEAAKREYDVELRDYDSDAKRAEAYIANVRANAKAREDAEKAKRERFEREVQAKRHADYLASPEGRAEAEKLRLAYGRS